MAVTDHAIGPCRGAHPVVSDRAVVLGKANDIFFLAIDNFAN